MTIGVNPEKNTALLASGLSLVSLPEYQSTDGGLPEIFVGKQLNNQVLLYVQTDSTIKKCFIDSDINSDND